MKAHLSCFSSAFAVLLLAAPMAMAQDGQPLARFDAWDVHVLERTDGKVCVVASQPTSSRPSNVVRSDILFMVTDWPANGTQYEVHIEMGYPLASDVTVVVDDESTFTMIIVEDEGAWLQSQVEDNLLATAMRRGRTMEVRARSTRGTDTVDIYSLIGISAALARAAEECA